MVADEAETLVVGKLRISAKWAIRRTVRIERLTITKALRRIRRRRPSRSPGGSWARRFGARMWAARGA